MNLQPQVRITRVNPKFVHSPTIKLITFEHGIEGLVPLGRTVSQVIRREIPPDATLLAEGRVLRRAIIPKNMVRRAGPLEPIETEMVEKFIEQAVKNRFGGISGIRLEIRLVVPVVVGYIREFVFPAKVLRAQEREKSPLLAKYYRWMTDRRITVEEAQALAGFDSGIRSFVMASALYDAAKTQKTIIGLMGSGHGGNVEWFLKNPRRAVRFGRFALSVINNASVANNTAPDVSQGIIKMISEGIARFEERETA
jgi:hypothetical protein